MVLVSIKNVLLTSQTLYMNTQGMRLGLHQRYLWKSTLLLDIAHEELAFGIDMHPEKLRVTLLLLQVVVLILLPRCAQQSRSVLRVGKA